MKHLKTKLITSVMMLLIAALMVSTASYAWFTLSTKPEIKGVKDTVVVNENLEIAKVATATAAPAEIPGAPEKGDTIYLTPTANEDGNYTWGNLVVRDDTGVLRPAELSAKATGSIVTLKLAATTLDAAKTEVEAYLVDLIKNGYEIKTVAGADIKLSTSNSNKIATYPAEESVVSETINPPAGVTGDPKTFNLSEGDYAAIFNNLENGKVTYASTVTGYTVKFKVVGEWFQFPEYMPDGRASNTMIGLAPQSTQYGFGQLDDINDYNYVTFFDTWVRTNMPNQVLDLQEAEANRSSGTGTNDGKGTFFQTDYKVGMTIKLPKTGNYSAYDEDDFTLNDLGLAAEDYINAIGLAFQDVTPDITGATGTKSAALVVANEGTVTKFISIGTGDNAKEFDLTNISTDADKAALVAAIVAEANRTGAVLRYLDKDGNKVESTDTGKIAYRELDVEVSFKKTFNTKDTVNGAPESESPAPTPDGTNDTKEQTGGKFICKLVANEAKMVRAYLYLNGSEVTNRSASYFGDKSNNAAWTSGSYDNDNGGVTTDYDNLPAEFTNAGTLNVQFQAADVEYSMDGLPNAERHVYTEE